MFYKVSTNKLKYKIGDLPKSKSGENVLPVLAAGVTNQGLSGYVPIVGATVLKNVITISANGACGSAYYQSNDFTVLQDAYALKFIENITLNKNQNLFIVGSITKSISGKYGYNYKSGWEKVKNDKIKLPIRNGKIDFDFIDNFIAELEAERVAELEAYLIASGLDNCKLTKEEEQSLRDIQSFEWRDFSIVDIATVKNTKNILSRDIIEDSGTIPYLGAGADNNSIISHISYDVNLIDKGNCIFIGGKTFVVTYQEKDFYSNDSHNLVLYFKESKFRDKTSQLFLATCLRCSLQHLYSWGDSVSNKKIQKDKIRLPINNTGQIAHEIINSYISAVQKLVIKDVVLWKDKIIANTKQVIEDK